MNLEFELSFVFKFEVIEIDERVLAMRGDIHIVMEQFQNAFRFDGAIWIEYSAWDTFVQALNAPSIDGALLVDMNDYFKLHVLKGGHGHAVDCSFQKADLGGERQAKLSFTSVIGDDEFAVLRDRFMGFKSWW